MTKTENQFNPKIVKALMALRGESQEDLAKAIGCGRSLLSKVLTNKANFSAELEKRLEEHYRVDSSIFFTSCVQEMEHNKTKK